MSDNNIFYDCLEQPTYLNKDKFLAVFANEDLVNIIKNEVHYINRSIPIKKYKLDKLAELYNQHPTYDNKIPLNQLLGELGLREQHKRKKAPNGKYYNKDVMFFLTPLEQLEKINNTMLKLPNNVIYKTKNNKYRYYKNKKIAIENLLNYIKQYV